MHEGNHRSMYGLGYIYARLHVYTVQAMYTTGLLYRSIKGSSRSQHMAVTPQAVQARALIKQFLSFFL